MPEEDFFVPAGPAPVLPDLYRKQEILTRLPQSMPVAMAYVPMQENPELYSPQMGFENGTMFPDLYKPFTGKRGVFN